MECLLDLESVPVNRLKRGYYATLALTNIIVPTMEEQPCFSFRRLLIFKNARQSVTSFAPGPEGLRTTFAPPKINKAGRGRRAGPLRAHPDVLPLPRLAHRLVFLP